MVFPPYAQQHVECGVTAQLRDLGKPGRLSYDRKGVARGPGKHVRDRNNFTFLARDRFNRSGRLHEQTRIVTQCQDHA